MRCNSTIKNALDRVEATKTHCSRVAYPTVKDMYRTIAQRASEAASAIAGSDVDNHVIQALASLHALCKRTGQGIAYETVRDAAGTLSVNRYEAYKMINHLAMKYHAASK